MLQKCHAFNFSKSYSYANKVRKAIFEDDFLADPIEVSSEQGNKANIY